MDEKELIINFLFWMQYSEQEKLLEDWLHAQASNRFVASEFIKWLDQQ